MAQRLIPIVHAATGQTGTVPERRLAAFEARGWQSTEDAGVHVDDDTGAVERPAGNATRDAWAIYARSQGVDVTDDMGRDDIRDIFPDPDQTIDPADSADTPQED